MRRRPSVPPTRRPVARAVTATTAGTHVYTVPVVREVLTPPAPGHGIRTW